MRILPSPYIMPGLIKEKINNIETIKAIICAVTGFTWEELLIPNRKRERVLARSLFFYFVRKKTLITLKSIGDMFHKDHSTVISGVNLVERLLFSKDYLTVEWFEMIKNRL